MPRKTLQMWRHNAHSFVLANGNATWNPWKGLWNWIFLMKWKKSNFIYVFLQVLNDWYRESKWLMAMYRISTSFSCHVKPRSSKCPVWPNKWISLHACRLATLMVLWPLCPSLMFVEGCFTFLLILGVCSTFTAVDVWFRCFLIEGKRWIKNMESTRDMYFFNKGTSTLNAK